MKKSELKAIIFECLDEIELDERGKGDPNSTTGRGNKVKPTHRNKPKTNVKTKSKIVLANKPGPGDDSLFGTWANKKIWKK